MGLRFRVNVPDGASRPCQRLAAEDHSPFLRPRDTPLARRVLMLLPLLLPVVRRLTEIRPMGIEKVPREAWGFGRRGEDLGPGLWIFWQLRYRSSLDGRGGMSISAGFHCRLEGWWVRAGTCE